MRKKMTVLLAAVMMLLITAAPAMAAPAAADFGLHTAHESIPEGVPGHEHVPFPSS
jgi:hypothetical protein